MALTKIGSSGLVSDSITEAQIADAAVENEHLNTNVISAQSELSEKGAANDVLLVYDTSSGTLKKISVVNLNLGTPTISSISPTNVDSKDSATTTTFTVIGTNFFTGTTAKLISNSATDISFTTVTRDSDTQLTCVLNNGLITLNTDEPYDIFVNNTISSTTLTNQVNVDQRPVFVTAAGSLGSVVNGDSASFTVEATDPESAGAIRYDVISGSLPSGLSLNTATGAITGTAPSVDADTTSTFTIQASDVDSNVSLREFSITVLDITIVSFTSSGTFAVPVGKTSVDVLVVAGGGGGGFDQGGGGGAGGLIFRPGFPVTPGGTVSVTVGCGGASTQGPAQRGTTGQDSVFGTLTAKGGGGAGSGDGAGPHNNGSQGGSGGATGWRGPNTPAPEGSGVVGQGIQPTQPGDSGTYGFGNPAGAANGYSLGPDNSAGRSSGGGGGAGAAGTAAAPHSAPGGAGGVGRAYTIADNATPVYYAGGGGGAGGQYPGHTVAPGGQGGGGAGGEYNAAIAAVSAQANKGGGGGGGVPSASPTIGGSGGKGIVIVKY